MAEGYTLHFANPTAIQKYTGLKYSDDQHDPCWLADMLRLGILPKGYSIRKKNRPIRDLLRKRGHLVKLRTFLVISLQNIIDRNDSFKLRGSKIMAKATDHVTPFLEYNEDLALAGIEAKIEGKAGLRKPMPNY